MAGACSNAARLDTLRDEPILDAPPDAVELLVTEEGGTRIGFGTPARVEVVWGVADPVDAVADWYVAEFGDLYGLDRQGRDTRYLGQRSVDGTGVTVSVHVVAGLDAVRWDSALGAEAEAAPWEGPVVVARASSG